MSEDAKCTRKNYRVCERKSGQEGFLPKENELNLEQNEIERQLGIVHSENERRRTSVF